MVDLEDLLRTEVKRRSEEFAPPAGMADRIEARARHAHQRRQRQRLGAGALLAGAAAAVVGLVLVPGQRDDGDDVSVGPGRESTTTSTTEARSSTTTTTEARPEEQETTTSSSTVPEATPSTTTATTAAPPAAPVAPQIGPSTPLSRAGIGPITAGMTLREAEAVAGVALTPFDPSVGGTCVTGMIEGANVQFLAERAGSSGDVGDSVIRTLSRAVEGSTEEGVAIGDPPSVLTATYGQPTRTVPEPDGQGSALHVFEAGGYAYAFLVNPEAIAVIDSGDPAWVGLGDPNGCA